MTAPAIALLAIAAVVGMSHSFRVGAMEYSLRFQDSAAYAAHVLDGTPMPGVSVQSENVSESEVVKAGIITLLALLLAVVSLSSRFNRLPRPLRLPMNAIRSLHSGVVGDYVMWMIIGVVSLGQPSCGF